MEFDKENREYQIVGRKAGNVETVAPRTPFSEVNRQSIQSSDATGTASKSSQAIAKSATRQRHTWAPHGLLQRQANEPSFTPLKSKIKETSLKKQVLQKEGDLPNSSHEEGTSEEVLKNVEQTTPFYSLPASPIVKLPPSAVGEVSAAASQSCPEMLTSDLPLPPLCDTPTHDTSASSSSPTFPMHDRSLSSPDIDLIMTCEEGTPPMIHTVSCEAESNISSFIQREEEDEFSEVNTTCDSQVSGTSSGSFLCAENNSSLTESSDEQDHSMPCNIQDEAAAPDSSETFACVKEDAAQTESVTVVKSILEEILDAVEVTVNGVPFGNQDASDKSVAANQNYNTLTNCGSLGYIAEYARYLKSYAEDGSPAFPSKTSSLTDVTPYSQNSGMEASKSSYISDSDESLSSACTIQRRIIFEDRDFTSPETYLDESTGFVRSSESKFDLRQDSHEGSPVSTRSSAERDFLNLSTSDQRVEFFALPSKLTSLTSSPIDGQSQDLSSSPTSALKYATSVPSKKLHEELSSATSVLTQDAQTMTGTSETDETSLSMTTIPNSPNVQSSTTITGTNSIALSPIAVSSCNKEINTSITQTRDTDTMTHVLTAEAALSPMAVAVREMSSMTTVAQTTEVGMATEETDCLDRSMLATSEVGDKTTMTDNTGRHSVFTSMTPLKALAKQGRRMNSDDIRKQHPRTLANQLDTLTVANTRLETEVKSAKQEQKRLQGLLKETKHALSSKEAEYAAAEKQKEEEWKEKMRQQEDECHRLQHLSEEKQNRITALELELSILRAASNTEVQKLKEDLQILQEKYQALEETHAHASQQYQQEVMELKNSQEANSYRLAFEHAQQMVREREAELCEIRGLFTDLQTTADKQAVVHSTYQEIHNKILSLAKENRSLKNIVSRRASLSREELRQKEAEMESLKQHNTGLIDELKTLQHTMTINNNNLSELEKLYSTSSSDLLTATGKVVELNLELSEAKKAAQEATLSKEALVRKINDLEIQLSAKHEKQASLTAALEHTRAQFQEQLSMHQQLQAVSQEMKLIYEDKLDNMTLGAENLQRTLDNREVDIDNLEKDLYECRNIIVEQRYKIDGLESELRDARNIAAEKKREEEGIEFFKKSNEFLEAERSLYVQSLRELEEKLKAANIESSRQQQAAVDAEQLIEELQEDKVRLVVELSSTQDQFVSTSRTLAQAKEEHSKIESVAIAAANDLLQHMHIMLSELKKKIGLQEVPELYPAKARSQPLPAPSRPVKSKRHSRKSFVSTILSAATRADEGGTSAAVDSDKEDEDWEKVETGSYLGDVIARAPADAGVSAAKPPVFSQSAKEGYWSSSDLSFRGPSLHQSSLNSTDFGTARLNHSSSALPDCGEPTFSGQQRLSMSWTEASRSKPGASSFSAFRPLNTSSSSLPGHPPYSLPYPPSSVPPVSAMAKIRSIPKTKRRSEQPQSLRLSPRGWEEREGESGLIASLASVKEVFSEIARLASIVDRASQLALQDLREENDMLRERTEILQECIERNRAQLSINQQEIVNKENTISQLQQESREMTEQMMAVTDQRFEVKRLIGEVKRLETELQNERSEKEVVSGEFNSLLHRLETSSASADGKSAQARCLRDILALKKKNRQLMNELEQQRDHYEELGSKAARRMRVLDDNWKKAEDELYRLDALVEKIRQIAERSSRSSSPDSSLHRILQFIQGENKSSPC